MNLFEFFGTVNRYKKNEAKNTFSLEAKKRGFFFVNSERFRTHPLAKIENFIKKISKYVVFKTCKELMIASVVLRM